MNSEEFYEEMKKNASLLDIDVNEVQARQFFQYALLLREWNEKINLTAITDFKEIILKHFIDSLTISKYIKQDDSVIDVGTGAGFPGIPLKIQNPNIKLDLLDSINKKLVFVQEVISSLTLENTNTYHSRIEDMGQDKKYREKYDVCTARAVAPLRVLLEYQLPFVKVGGICICMKGPNALNEIKESENALKILGAKIEKTEELNLNNDENQRTIIVVRKEKMTPNMYPRKPGAARTSSL